MKKNMKAFLLALMMVLSAVLMAACGDLQGSEGNAPLSKEADYKVTVTDVTGTPCADVTAVKFMQNGQQAAMQLVQNGTAVKKLTRGDYTVELQFGNTEQNYVYDAETAKLTKEVTELQIIVSQTLGENYYDLYVGDESSKAYFVSVGGTNITLNPASRSYYIFAPNQAGLYEFSLTGSNAALGYYGGTHFVQSASAAEVVDNKFTISVSEGNLGSSYVIGIDAGEGNAILGISRIGEPNWTIDQEPWTIYNPKHTPVPYTLPAGTKLNKFDLTASTDTYNLVLNEAEGFYHLNSADGPLVLVKIGKTGEDSGTEVQSDYLPPFEVILEDSGVRRYFFDENGEFLKKEEYSNCLLTYIENVDEASGMYPLTDDLMYIIQNQGIQAGWWDVNGQGYLFVDGEGNKVPGINSEIAWLFMCRYAG